MSFSGSAPKLQCRKEHMLEDNTHLRVRSDNTRPAEEREIPLPLQREHCFLSVHIMEAGGAGDWGVQTGFVLF